MKKLTKTEEQVMQLIWKLKTAFVKDIIAELPDPKPPYNTVSSVVRLLVDKGFVGYKAYGRTYEYHPIVSKSDYRKFLFRNLFTDYFDGSLQQLASFFTKEEEQLKIDDLKAILKELEEQEKGE